MERYLVAKREFKPDSHEQIKKYTRGILNEFYLRGLEPIYECNPLEIFGNVPLSGNYDLVHELPDHSGNIALDLTTHEDGSGMAILRLEQKSRSDGSLGRETLEEFAWWYGFEIPKVRGRKSWQYHQSPDI